VAPLFIIRITRVAAIVAKTAFRNLDLAAGLKTEATDQIQHISGSELTVDISIFKQIQNNHWAIDESMR
jgi:hypothetical protein